MKVIGYVRVSTEEQARSGVSIEAQEAKIRDYCKVNNMELLEIVQDSAVSGSTRMCERPSQWRMAHWMNQGAEGVVAVKLDRLFRNTLDALQTIETFNNRGVSIHLIDFNGMTLNTNSPMGQMMVTMSAAFAQLERDMIRERINDAMQHKKAQGKCVGQVPFGYTKEGEDVVKLPFYDDMMSDIAELLSKGSSCRLIAECIQSDYGIKVSHVTINKIKKENHG